MDVKYHLLKDMQNQRLTNVEYLSTEEMTANALMKSLPGDYYRTL